MPDRFTYSPALAQELKDQARRRRWLWLFFLAPFWAYGTYHALTRGTWLGPTVALCASAMAAFFEWLLRRVANKTSHMLDQSLESDGTLLKQLARDGTVLGQIDLTRPFVVTYPYSAAGNAVYRVTQVTEDTTRRSLEFASEIQDAERLVRDILKYDEWPPGENAT
jgi:hypothetical protein